MNERAGADGELSIVVVEGGRDRAIVPSRPGDRLLAVPGGSVTVEGIRRAARSVRDQQDGRNVASIAQATLGPEACEGCR